MPAKFEVSSLSIQNSTSSPLSLQELPGEVVYNVSEEVGRAAILVISQVEEHRVQVTLTLTSTEMRGTPSPEQTQGMCLIPHTLST